MPIQHDHYLIAESKKIHQAYDASAVKKPVAIKHAELLAKRTGKVVVIVRVIKIVVPEKRSDDHAEV